MDGDPHEVVTRVRSAALALGLDAAAGFAAPDGPLRGAHVRLAREEMDRRGRDTFLAERWATQPIAARARVIWRGWAQAFAGSLRWQVDGAGTVAPRMRERLDELTSLLSGPATRGELRILDAYESYFQVLFTLGWSVVRRVDPGGDGRRLPAKAGSEADPAIAAAWRLLVSAWVQPWRGRRRHDEVCSSLFGWIESDRVAAVPPAAAPPASVDARPIGG